MASLQCIKGPIKPLRDRILVRNIQKGIQKTAGGILLPDDNATERGIHPRWARVYAVGSDIDYVKVGQWVLMEHGRWSEGFDLEENGEIFDLRLAEGKSLLMVSDDEPGDANVGNTTY